eukprot:NODE_392_length_8143_cov_0.403282.p7 type:complete len:172 gc:universal NODE_392_length_8143_cov_0.403282:658-143(-)
MIYSFPLYAIPQTTMDTYTPIVDGSIANEYQVTHLNNLQQCTVSYGLVVSCLYTNGQSVEFFNSDDSVKYKQNGADTSIPLIQSMDFKGNSICFVLDKSDNGGIYCGTQPIQGGLASTTLSVKQMTGSDVTDIRISSLYPYMCLRNWNSQVWCMATDLDLNGSPVFDTTKE